MLVGHSFSTFWIYLGYQFELTDVSMFHEPLPTHTNEHNHFLWHDACTLRAVHITFHSFTFFFGITDFERPWITNLDTTGGFRQNIMAKDLCRLKCELGHPATATFWGVFVGNVNNWLVVLICFNIALIIILLFLFI